MRFNDEPWDQPDAVEPDKVCLELRQVVEPEPVDLVNYPPHYLQSPSGVECIDVIEHLTYNLGAAIKYLWRVDYKGAPIQDLEKAEWYVHREIERRRRLAEGGAK